MFKGNVPSWEKKNWWQQRISKKVGAGWCFAPRSIPSSFNISPYTSGNRGDQMMEFGERNVVPFLSGSELLHGPLCCFKMRQMFAADERSRLQAGQFGPWTLKQQLCFWNGCSFALSCWKMQGLPWERCCVDGSRCICLSPPKFPFCASYPLDRYWNILKPSEMQAFQLRTDNNLDGPSPL